MLDYSQFILGYKYWAWMGTFYLIFLTYKDYKNNRVIDDRHNYIMLGASSALLSHIHRPIWYMLIVLCVLIALNFYLRRFELIGGADITAISWIFLGNFILGPTIAAWYFVFFTIATGFFTFLRFGVFKYRQDVAFFGVILVTFFFNSYLMRLY